ncbi:hypothetical protein FUAX_52150 (plasmid) [Fulvitalea axinellae]|uniref:ParB/Sulfiredoxin domain-containing protein n=1 Tax=Fulvitalea axinellae TaxID=1182444 RepID=A0AAU9CXV7_9BACT|nr:hypothetical protein FUAX_52150 [Fulvitalea axinellae]
MNKRKRLIPTIALAKDKKLAQDAEIKNKIRIYDELRDLIPPLVDEEFEQLEANILKEGCREPLLYWHNKQTDEYVLVDGHNRHRVCTTHGLDFPLKAIEVSDLQTAKDWMIDNQLGRRNLSKEQKIYLVGLRYNREKEDRGGYKGSMGQNDPLTKYNENTEIDNHDFVGEKSMGQNDPLTKHNEKQEKSNSAERIAKENNMSPKSVKRAANYATGLDKLAEENPEIKTKILSGKLKVKQADIESLSKSDSIPKLESEKEIGTQAEKARVEKRTVKKDSSKPTIQEEPVWEVRTKQIVESELFLTESINRIKESEGEKKLTEAKKLKAELERYIKLFN